MKGVRFVVILAVALTVSAFTVIEPVRGKQGSDCLAFLQSGKTYLWDLESGVLLEKGYQPPEVRTSDADSLYGIRLIYAFAFAPTKNQPTITVWRNENSIQRSAALINLDGTQRAVIFEYADNFDDPYWSPDGKYAAVVWETKRNGMVHLTWVNAETGTTQRLSDTQWNIRDLRWLGGSTGLFFVAERRSAEGEPIFSAEYLVPATGAQRTLATQKGQIGNALPQGDDLQFWWRTGNTFGVARHAPDGELIFQYSAEDDGSTPLIGRVYRQEKGLMPFGTLPQAFAAPTGGHGALVVGESRGRKVYLVYPEGRWHLLRDNLMDATALAWSSDGMRLAFIQKIDTTTTIEVVTADGTLIQNIDLPTDAEALHWTHCGYSE